MSDTPQVSESLPAGIDDMPWVDPPVLPPTDLPYDDGDRMESPWHAHSLSIMTASIIASRGGRMEDYYVGTNMFVYYSLDQVTNVEYCGPDIYVVDDVDGQRRRQYWAIWEENGRYPDVVVELLSPSIETEDLGRKKELYQRTFRTSEYFCIAPDVERLLGWRLTGRSYTPIMPDGQGRLWSERLGCSIGAWPGTYRGHSRVWPRLYQQDGQLVLLEEEAERERAEAERERRERAEQQAHAEHERAEELAARVAALEAELKRLRGES